MLKVNDKVVVDKRLFNTKSEPYTIVKFGSTGRIVKFARLLHDNCKVAVVEFDNLVTDVEKAEKIQPVLLWSLTKAKTPKLKKRTNFNICADCHTVVSNKKMKKITLENKEILVCEECANYYKTCSITGKTYDIKDLVYLKEEKDYIHKDIFKKYYDRCIYCDSSVRKDTVKKGKFEEICCPRCFENLYFTCEHCSSLCFLASENDLATSPNEVNLMANGQNSWETRHPLDDSSQIRVCADCYNLLVPLKNYSFTPSKLLYQREKWEKDAPLLMGVELEVLCPPNSSSLKKEAERIMKYTKKLGVNKYYYIKRDSSVSYRNREGFEIVTHPFTLKTKYRLKFKELLDYLKKRRYTSYQGGVCGLHVHLSKNFFSKIDQQKLRTFFMVNYDDIYLFSKRAGQGDRYCSRENEEWKQLYKQKQPEGRYALSFNTKNGSRTIECRIFRGTLNYFRFLATLQFCYAMSYWIKEVSIATLRKRCWREFLHWAEKEGYDIFVKYIKKLNQVIDNNGEE